MVCSVARSQLLFGLEEEINKIPRKHTFIPRPLGSSAGSNPAYLHLEVELTVNIYQAQSLATTSRVINPYVRIALASAPVPTHVIYASANPIWNECKTFTVLTPSNFASHPPMITVTVHRPGVAYARRPTVLAKPITQPTSVEPLLPADPVPPAGAPPT
mgnify:CR=1 FL=1